MFGDENEAFFEEVEFSLDGLHVRSDTVEALSAEEGISLCLRGKKMARDSLSQASGGGHLLSSQCFEHTRDDLEGGRFISLLQVRVLCELLTKTDQHISMGIIM